MPQPSAILREKEVYGPMATVGSRGVRASWQMLLQAGASARGRLMAAAAQRWIVPASECEATNSKVTHKKTGHSFEYGDLAADAGRIKLDKEPAIRTPDQFKLIGKPLPRLDTPLKINGAAKFSDRHTGSGHGLCGGDCLSGVRRHAQKRRRFTGKGPPRRAAGGQAQRRRRCCCRPVLARQGGARPAQARMGGQGGRQYRQRPIRQALSGYARWNDGQRAQ